MWVFLDFGMSGLRVKEGGSCPVRWPSVFPFSLSSTRFDEIKGKKIVEKL